MYLCWNLRTLEIIWYNTCFLLMKKLSHKESKWPECHMACLWHSLGLHLVYFPPNQPECIICENILWNVAIIIYFSLPLTKYFYCVKGSWNQIACESRSISELFFFNTMLLFLLHPLLLLFPPSSLLPCLPLYSLFTLPLINLFFYFFMSIKGQHTKQVP